MGNGLFMISINNKSEAEVQAIKAQIETFVSSKPDWNLVSSEYHSKL